MYKVYVLLDENDTITRIDSDVFLTDITGWAQIDEGDGDRCHHAQSHYFPKPLMTVDGVFQYKLVVGEDGAIRAAERTEEEIAADIAALPTPPPTAEEKMRQAEMRMSALKPLMTELVKEKSADLVICTLEFILPWTEGAYVLGDIRMWQGQPRRCCQAHDSTGNPAWTPEVASLWAPFHGTRAEFALPWVQPTGAHDMYKAGEYMVWTDAESYLCKLDTVYSPLEYAGAWVMVS